MHQRFSKQFVPTFPACVASVSVWFWSKEKKQKGVLVLAMREMKQEPFSRSVTLVPRSLLQNRTETLATQATTFLA